MFSRNFAEFGTGHW